MKAVNHQTFKPHASAMPWSLINNDTALQINHTELKVTNFPPQFLFQQNILLINNRRKHDVANVQLLTLHAYTCIEHMLLKHIFILYTCSCIGVSNRAILVRPRSDFQYDVTIFFLHHTESHIDRIETDTGLKLQSQTNLIDFDQSSRVSRQ